MSMQASQCRSWINIKFEEMGMHPSAIRISEFLSQLLLLTTKFPNAFSIRYIKKQLFSFSLFFFTQQKLVNTKFVSCHYVTHQSANRVTYRVHFIKRRGSNRRRFHLGDAVIYLQSQIRDASLTRVIQVYYSNKKRSQISDTFE